MAEPVGGDCFLFFLVFLTRPLIFAISAGRRRRGRTIDWSKTKVVKEVVSHLSSVCSLNDASFLPPPGFLLTLALVLRNCHHWVGYQSASWAGRVRSNYWTSNKTRQQPHSPLLTSPVITLASPISLHVQYLSAVSFHLDHQFIKLSKKNIMKIICKSQQWVEFSSAEILL